MATVPSINDIAKAADVSRATVSRVLNNSPEVSEKTRELVLKLVNDLQYIPNSMARSLVRRKTDTIGILINNVTDYFFGRIIRGIEVSISASRFNVAYANNKYNTDDHMAPAARFKKNIRLLSQGKVDGIIIATTNELDTEDVDFLTSRGISFVVIQNMLKDGRVSSVNIDNFKGAYDATRYLIGLGHRNILHVTGQLESSIARERLEGFKSALAESGIGFGEKNMLSGNFRFNQGYLRMKEVISWENKPTAIFFGNDLMALGAIKAAYEEHVRIPEDISIIGFDGLIGSFEFDGLMPNLTTMHQPMAKLGEYAARMLMEQIDGQNKEPRQVFLDVDLVDKGSCRSIL